MKPRLTIEYLQTAAAEFAAQESVHAEPSIFGVTDGKAIGTYLEHKFTDFLGSRYHFEPGNSARGIDLPELGVDLKNTSVRQPQSSCPYENARQKIYGLGYSLMVFVYDKTDDAQAQTGRLAIEHVIFVDESRTADYQMTRGLLEILGKDGNEDDLIAFMSDKNLPVDDIEATQIAQGLLETPPLQGYLTISNALQWRLQYSRVISEAGTIDGILRLR